MEPLSQDSNAGFRFLCYLIYDVQGTYVCQVNSRVSTPAFDVTFRKLPT